RPVVLLALLALLAAVLAGGGWWYATAGPGAYTSVPDDLVGQDIADARVMLAEAGLDAEPTDVFDAEAPTGTVLSVVPDEGARIVKDGTVDLTVSKGPDLRVVPAGLVGLPVAEARAALEAAGFVVPEPERQYDDAVPVDVVVGVSQEGDTQLPVDTEVVLTISSGPAPLTIPGVLGVPKDEAIAALTAVGLVVNADAVGYSDEHPAGTVMAQDPVGGAAGFRTGTVTLTISQGPPLVAVPDVFSTQFDQAKATLEGLGLVVVREDLLGGVFGTVRNQSVAPGAMVPKGTQITLTVV
ncbi:MAG: serine/threonine protein kinase with sensor(s), partial [Actinotalea sp.]|nr:serine/threonine protein kinase with sensor(s) [Actinotalea sp.]